MLSMNTVVKIRPTQPPENNGTVVVNNDEKKNSLRWILRLSCKKKNARSALFLGQYTGSTGMQADCQGPLILVIGMRFLLQLSFFRCC